MNKILNWTFGACFRTLGRFIAIFFILALFLFIGSKLDIKLPDWLAFNVNASENVNMFLPDCQNCVAVTTGYRGKTLYENPGQGYQKLILTTPYNILNNSEKFNFSSYFYSRSAYEYTTYPIEGAQDGVTETNIYLPGNSYTIFIEYINIYNDYMYNSCNVVSNQNNGFANVVCDIPRDAKQIYSFIFYYNISNPATDLQPIYTGYNRNISFTMKDNSNQTIIENQEQTNDKLDDMNQTQNDIKDSINNNDTTGAEDSASGFFDNFSSEDYGLSSIITAPLRAINAMLSDTCVAPGATYKGQSFSLPCGSMLWNRPGGLNLKNFINIMYGGFLAYFVIRSLFLDIEKLKNPDSDKVEVQKL